MIDYLDDTPTAAYARLNAAIEKHGNHWEAAREQAINAVLDNRPAFWNTTDYSDQISRGMLWPLNKDGRTIDDALTYAQARFRGTDECRRVVATLIPLNRKAALMLEEWK